MKKIKIAFVSSEVAPYSKTGGLADVAGALPHVVAGLKQEVALFSPKYPSANSFEMKPVATAGDLKIQLGGSTYKYNLLRQTTSVKDLAVYFIDCPTLFQRAGLYQDPKTGKDYEDNDIRFAFFALAVLQSLELIGFQPDIIHANDWQSALIPAYLKTTMKGNQFFSNTRSILTIHNVGYQGLFPPEKFDPLGFDKSMFYAMSPFEFWGKLSFLKSGIAFSDAVTTVSETYALEIQSSSEYGFGLEGVLHDKQASLFGVVNGVDYDIWSPEADKLIAKQYNGETLDGKTVNKSKLLAVSGLAKDRQDKPLIGVISRLADQKGFDLIAEVAKELFALDFTFVLLGTGDKKYHELFATLQKQYPAKIKANLTFDNTLAHQIEAGADMFLMPSRYEPCGLNQLYSLKYGTVPVARKTGGLADTIIDETTNKGKGTGFLFEEYSGEALLDAVNRSLEFYRNKRAWNSLMKRGMKKDFSWKKSAKKYLEIYQKTIEA